jgi:hypothetical protein
MKTMMLASFILVLTLIGLIPIACGVEYSANVIAGDEMLLVEIDCPPEVQEKSRFMVNVTITNPAAENATDVIVELVAQRKFFSYGQPKKRIGNIEGHTRIVVCWDVRAKRSGTYNITTTAIGKTEFTGEMLSAQDQEAIVVEPTESPDLFRIIYTIRLFFRQYF